MAHPKKKDIESDFLNEQEQIFYTPENDPALGVYLPHMHNVERNLKYNLI